MRGSARYDVRDGDACLCVCAVGGWHEISWGSMMIYMYIYMCAYI